MIQKMYTSNDKNIQFPAVEHLIRQLFGIPDSQELNLSFECLVPDSGVASTVYCWDTVIQNIFVLVFKIINFRSDPTDVSS